MTQITLFHSPGSCSEGIAFLLRRIGMPHSIEDILLSRKDHQSPEFLARNPKGKVPALLRPDGTVLTEFTAIAFWLGKTYPEAGLLGPTPEDEARALELLDFIVASLHMRGFTFLKVPQKFSPDPAFQDQIRTHGKTEIEKNLVLLSEMLGDSDFLLGRMGIADAAAFYTLTWATQEDVAVPANLTALFRRLQALDA